jgi:hypothetical protein
MLSTIVGERLTRREMLCGLLKAAAVAPLALLGIKRAKAAK